MGERDSRMDPLLEAATFKVEMAEAHLAELDNVRDGHPRERLYVQMHVEGVLRCGVSAGDQLAKWFGDVLGLKLWNASPDRLFKALARAKADVADDLAYELDEFRRWSEIPIVVDARRRRNLAVHQHYVKRPYAPERTWVFEAIKIDGHDSPYDGPLDVHKYCTSYAQTLREVAGLAQMLDARGEQPGATQPVSP